MKSSLSNLKVQLSGELHTSKLMKALYATDASVYRELPLAVALPKTKKDIELLIQFANKNNTTLIPRTAGTSLAGQCVGNGIVVDVSKHFNTIIEVSEKEKWVKVEPSVIRDELNRFLKEKGLFFGPETSTANRAMMGGMVGNNSCGTNSIVYGSTRNHLLEVEAFLSDGSLVTFKALSKEEFEEKCGLQTLEGSIYRQILDALSKNEVQEEIVKEFPKASIHRRNTGYAIDELLKQEPFSGNKENPFNFCSLIAGSEGTIAFITSIKLNCVSLPPPNSQLLAVHFYSVEEALKGVLVAIRHQPAACELMDKTIMDCTKGHLEYEQYRSFMINDPNALLLIEIRAEKIDEVEEKIKNLIAGFKEKNLGYAFPVLHQENAKNVWQLRKAGLGLLANVPGDKKAVAVIEDTAVDVEDLPNYIAEFTTIMQKYNQNAVYYAHAGAGELHLRPLLNLKEKKDINLFKKIASDTADLVKKYNGSLSGEHGDGRVRAVFLEKMVGKKNYELLKEIKYTWDKNNVFNAGKIIDVKPIEENLRYDEYPKQLKENTLMDFSDGGGFLRMAEKCNGSGDCRKLAESGGTMCPSYMATKNEKDSTRARANALREFLTQNNEERKKWDSKEIKEALDLCLSCKGCKSECPSNVDMAALKAEYLYQNHKIKGSSVRSKLFGNVGKLNKLGSLFPGITNSINSLSISKSFLGIHPKRSAPKLAKQTLKKWFLSRKKTTDTRLKTIYLFADEFTNYLDVEIGKKTVLLLEKLGYTIKIAPIEDSGRAFISKGLLEEAKSLAENNFNKLKNLISDETPLVGIEPSAILSFRDEYIRLIPNYEKSTVAKNSLTIEEFLAKEIDLGFISESSFTEKHQQVKLHGHCHQKALSKISFSEKILSIPKNYHVDTIPSGCCGMAGSFGYEKEHYDISMDIGNLVLFPAVKKSSATEIICAAGTSCRHQIFDGTKRVAQHPVEVLYGALKK